MKKGFTMIELIFVIVILGILASVAIPRLAGTRTDAEISATVANIRTLISDAASYYAVKGQFAGAKWGDITNVSIRTGDSRIPVQANTNATNDVYLAAGGTNCLVVRLRDKNNAATPPIPVAFIQIAKVDANVKKGICPEILAAAPIKAYLDLTVPGVPREGGAPGNRPGVIALGSKISIHE
nr:type II secretion system protein [uncultured Campylobacter sp.]